MPSVEFEQDFEEIDEAEPFNVEDNPTEEVELDDESDIYAVPPQDIPAAKSRRYRTPPPDPVEEEEEPEDEAPQQQPQRAAPPQRPRQDSEYNQLAARHRILERRFENMLQRIQEAQRQMAEQQAIEEPKIPDEEDDPLGHVAAQVKLLRSEQQRQQLRQLEKEKQDAARDEFLAARSEAIEYKSAIGEQVYDSAIAHLTSVAFEEMQDEYPHMTGSEIRDVLAAQLTQRMVAWKRNGKNVGEEMFKLARRRGFVPPSEEENEDNEAPVTRAAAAPRKVSSVSKPKSDAREEVAADKARAQKARTITSVAGTTPGSPITAEKLARMSEEEFDEAMDGVDFRTILRSRARR